MKKILLLLFLIPLLTGCTDQRFGQIPPISDIALEEMQKKYDKAIEIKQEYKMEKASFVKEAIDENAIQVEVGDKTKDEFEASLTLRKWDDEVSMKIKPNLQGIAKKDRTLKLEDKKIKFDVGKKEYHFYSVGETATTSEAYEFEIILKEKPTTNVISLDIETKGLSFYHQPPLNLEDNPEADYCTETDCYKNEKVITHRPENVVGSYAVYHSTKSNHILYPIDKTKYTQEELNQMVESKKYIGKINSKTDEVDYFKLGKNYQNGKAFHIFRPKIIDNAGIEVWGNLNIDEEKKILTVTIDQDWLDNAVYPVIVDPTFGITSQGQTGYSVTGSDRLRGVQGTTDATGGTAQSVTMWVRHWSGGTAHIKGYIFLQSNDSYIGKTDEWNMPGDHDGEHTINFTDGPTLLASTDYVVAVNNDALYAIYFDNFTNPPPNHEDGYTYNGTGSASLVENDRKYSIYCTYTAGGAEDTCTCTPGSDWYISAADSCYLSTSCDLGKEYSVYILNDKGPGSFNIIDDAVLSVHSINNTSTPVNVEAGSKIEFK